MHNCFIKIRVVLCFGLNLWFSTYDLLKLCLQVAPRSRTAVLHARQTFFPLLSPSGCSWERLGLFFRSIFCPGAHSHFPFTRLMLFYPGDLGTQIINDSRLQLGYERTQRGPNLRQKKRIMEKMMRNGNFNLLKMLGM